MKTEIEYHKNDQQNFKFQLYCLIEDKLSTPIIRLDSKGYAHDNGDEYPLEQRQITTPHINIFNKLGKNVAYKASGMEHLTHQSTFDLHKLFQIFCKEAIITLNTSNLEIVFANPSLPTITPNQSFSDVQFP
jgi:hypothetical protein